MLFFCIVRLLTFFSTAIQVCRFLQAHSSPFELHHPQHHQVVCILLIVGVFDPLRFHPNIFIHRAPILGFWGGSALVGVLFFADSIPRLQRDIFQKLPIVGCAYDRSIPASDSPF